MSAHDRPVAHREWDAATYDRIADPQTRWGAAVLERLVLRGDETVLDCGCGSGRVTEQLLARLPRGRVVALDVSSNMLDEARGRLGWAGAWVGFVQEDLLELSPATLGDDAPVDAVFSTATFHWVTDHERLFGNLAAVLRPGGQLVVQCGAEGNIAGLLAVVRRLGIERAGDWHYAGVDITRERLAAAGFEDLHVWIHEELTRFDDDESFLDFLEAVCLRQALAGMAAEESRDLVRAVAAAMPEPVLDYVRLNITARRGPAASRHNADGGQRRTGDEG